jgi:hypothetical protein
LFCRCDYFRDGSKQKDMTTNSVPASYHLIACGSSYCTNNKIRNAKWYSVHSEYNTSNQVVYVQRIRGSRNSPHKASIVYLTWRWPVGAETCSEWEKNKKRELTYWNFVGIDGVIGSQVGYQTKLTAPCEADSLSASKEISHVVWNPKVL